MATKYFGENSAKAFADNVKELVDEVRDVELTYAEYQALSDEEKNNNKSYYITDVDDEGVITGYTGGTGITIGEDKVIAIKDIKKNYIDNSNFRINQTSQSEYIATDSTIYTVDRWYIDGGTLTVMENGVQFVNPNTEAGSSSLIRLKQNIGYSFAEFAGKTVTLSAKINDIIYTGTATIPTEKPTEGTAVQYIASGIADFGINLNYSITGDYFVPYLALAYNKTVVIEWMKLEVNDVFSGYIEPDYSTELIKMNMTTSDKGALSLPYTKAETDAKISEELNAIRFTEYERLIPSIYSPNPTTMFVGYKPPSFHSTTEGVIYDFIITDKKDVILYQAKIVNSGSGVSTITWINNNKPTNITIFTAPGQAKSWNMLCYIMTTTPVLTAYVGDSNASTTVSGFKPTLSLIDMVTCMDIYGKYNIYMKLVSE